MIHKELARIQRELKAPKDHKNDFGGYQYRSAEQILGALKPILGDCSITLSDNVKEVGGRVYVEATATLWLDNEMVQTRAYARESQSRKGMDDSQLTGSTSSYARKYALCGLFGIDDNKDADTNEFASAAQVDEQMQEVKNKARAMLNAVIACQDAARRNIASITAVQESIAAEDLSTAKEAWMEIPREDQEALWLATTKGGLLSVHERNIIKSDEFSQA